MQGCKVALQCCNVAMLQDRALVRELAWGLHFGMLDSRGFCTPSRQAGMQTASQITMSGAIVTTMGGVCVCVCGYEGCGLRISVAGSAGSATSAVASAGSAACRHGTPASGTGAAAGSASGTGASAGSGQQGQQGQQAGQQQCQQMGAGPDPCGSGVVPVGSCVAQVAEA